MCIMFLIKTMRITTNATQEKFGKFSLSLMIFIRNLVNSSDFSRKKESFLKLSGRRKIIYFSRNNKVFWLPKIFKVFKFFCSLSTIFRCFYKDAALNTNASKPRTTIYFLEEMFLIFTIILCLTWKISQQNVMKIGKLVRRLEKKLCDMDGFETCNWVTPFPLFV